MKSLFGTLFFSMSLMFLAAGSFIAGEAAHGGAIAFTCTSVAVLALLVSAVMVFKERK